LAIGIPVSSFGSNGGSVADSSETLQVKPQVKYMSKGRRDPFVKPLAGRLFNVMQKVDIETLRLTGVIRNSRQAVALFASQSGPKFGFLLKNGKLYRENHQTVSGITGKVVNPGKVILKQGEKQIVFKLRAK